MEYHWYEDYWAMPRNLPKGHQFAIGYYQAQRALRFHVENIHDYCEVGSLYCLEVRKWKRLNSKFRSSRI